MHRDQSSSRKRTRDHYDRRDEDRSTHSTHSSHSSQRRETDYSTKRHRSEHRERRRKTWDDPHNSPHVRQVFLNGQHAYECRTDLPFQRTLTSTSQRLQYRRRKGEEKTVIHWGQRKLLLSEIEFLSMYGKKGHPVVYAGAAPGTHISYLVELFPDFEFFLYDPAPFTVKESNRVFCHQQLFTDEVAEKFAGKQALFISDIRAADWSLLSEDETDAQVREDMESQQRWHLIMQPLKSMLKFRLSWKPGKTVYLKGDIYLPIWGPITTTEARLIPSDGLHEYDNTAYEEQMFFFNTVQRVGLYNHDVIGEGLDYCYDCKAEVETLKLYLETQRGRLGESQRDINDEVARLSANISKACASKRTLNDGNTDPELRKLGIAKRQWIKGVPAYIAAKEGLLSKTEEKEDVPVYSAAARAYMEKYGYSEGHGLGPDQKGIAKPISAYPTEVRRGLGFDKASYVGQNFTETENFATSKKVFEQATIPQDLSEASEATHPGKIQPVNSKDDSCDSGAKVAPMEASPVDESSEAESKKKDAQESSKPSPDNSESKGTDESVCGGDKITP
eukprot:TRINITY_DN3475_c0_g1_i1.p1 TRINITY_DN3475_c0_g1~~TRINITY_DN3475_c0_g1_i1.p1  ORF type:complete len:561 (-),score=88.29 TRINITY_DN3475_c0_g1_i1:168-1850(-)